MLSQAMPASSCLSAEPVGLSKDGLAELLQHHHLLLGLQAEWIPQATAAGHGHLQTTASSV